MPYYGAYMAASFLANGTSISALDDGSSAYGGYATFSEAATPIKILLYNSEYYDGGGNRTSQTFVLTGLTVDSVSAKRLTTSSATSTEETGDVSISGQNLADATCNVEGAEVLESTSVIDGQASFEVASSEALLIIL